MNVQVMIVQNTVGIAYVCNYAKALYLWYSDNILESKALHIFNFFDKLLIVCKLEIRCNKLRKNKKDMVGRTPIE